MSELLLSGDKVKRAYPYIGVMGATGSGKSTLCGAVSGPLPINCFEEEYGENPYLSLFYQRPVKYSYLSERWFLLSKISQMRKLSAVLKEGIQVHDPCLEMDRIYALTHFRMGWMTKSQVDAYENTLNTLQEQLALPKPDIYLAVTTDGPTCKKRIRERGRKMELELLSSGYFDHLARGVEEWVESAKSSGADVVEIDGVRLDFTGNGGHRNSVVGIVGDRIRAWQTK